MRSLRPKISRGAIVLLALLLAAPAKAQVGGPPGPPATLWHFLGIPQGVRKLQGATRNRRGNHPNREPKPPMKALADPANLESKDPAIKRAAEIKQAEDLKKQKIKAVKYLASIGCGCYDKDGSVTAALVASMGDCTEDVRYETIKAISEAAEGGCCSKCGMTCCCNKDVLMAMAKTAYERDDHGCYLEPSERVREAAAEALQNCCPNDSPPVIVDAEKPRESGREAGGEEIEERELRETAPDAPTPSTPQQPSDAEPLPPGPAPSTTTGADLPSTPGMSPSAAANQASESNAGNPTSEYGYGVIIDVSSLHGLAHVHFDQANTQAPIGSVIGVYERDGAQRRLLAKLQIVDSFPGSANVTGSAEDLARISRGDIVLRPSAAPPAPYQPATEVAAHVATQSPTEPSKPVMTQAPAPSSDQAMSQEPAFDLDPLANQTPEWGPEPVTFHTPVTQTLPEVNQEPDWAAESVESTAAAGKSASDASQPNATPPAPAVSRTPASPPAARVVNASVTQVPVQSHLVQASELRPVIQTATQPQTPKQVPGRRRVSANFMP